MGVPIMNAIEYNTWMSVLRFMGEFVAGHKGEYGISGNVGVLPSYPRDITRVEKPAMIVQRVHTKSRNVGMGAVLGVYHDQDDGAIYDAYGKIYNMSYQIDSYTGGNIVRDTITGMIRDALTPSYDDDGIRSSIPLYDYSRSRGNPVIIGAVDVDDDIDVSYVASNDNDDYVSVVMVDMVVVQSIIPTGGIMVDLSKPIKWTQSIH